jgi:alkylhydroperoxidase family enzyme
LVFDYRQCGFDEIDTALCQYAVKLTLIPGKMESGDVDRLRDLGLDDRQITVATQVISYFNYINRVADGLGVDLDDWMNVSYDQWMEQKPNWAKLMGT